MTFSFLFHFLTLKPYIFSMTMFFFGILCHKLLLLQSPETAYILTFQIQVEHFIREEKMVAAYDLIELYCELIAARLPIIESQKYVKFHYFR